MMSTTIASGGATITSATAATVSTTTTSSATTVTFNSGSGANEVYGLTGVTVVFVAGLASLLW